MIVKDEIQKRKKAHEPLTIYDIRLHGYHAGITSSFKE